MNKIKAVIFDVDETLVDRKAAFVRFCEHMIDTYAKEYPFRGTRDELLAYMNTIDKNGYAALSDFLVKLKEYWPLPLTISEFITYRNDIFGFLTVSYPETKEVLDSLAGKYKLGVITNGYSKVQRKKIEMIGVTHYFDDIIVSGEEDFAKPDARIFLKSCEHLGIRPEEAVYIGDYYPNDIEGALSANITPIWICQDPKEHPEYQGIRVARLRDIVQYI